MRPVLIHPVLRTVDNPALASRCGIPTLDEEVDEGRDAVDGPTLRAWQAVLGTLEILASDIAWGWTFVTHFVCHFWGLRVGPYPAAFYLGVPLETWSTQRPQKTRTNQILAFGGLCEDPIPTFWPPRKASQAEFGRIRATPQTQKWNIKSVTNVHPQTSPRMQMQSVKSS
jgi:hypothetical protein